MRETALDWSLEQIAAERAAEALLCYGPRSRYNKAGSIVADTCTSGRGLSIWQTV